jgi:shikimate kinase
MSQLFLGKPAITLTGFMFSGKSSVGRVLARRLRLRFVDLDARIVRKAGCSIDSIFREKGEPEFRRLEREAVARVLPVPGQVVAVGGGAVNDPDNRALFLKHSCVIWLKASPGMILERWHNSRGRVRPLLEVENPEQEIIRLFEARRQYYEQCDFSVDTDGLPVDTVCNRIINRFSGSGV